MSRPRRIRREKNMATKVSPWGKPGAWALDSEEHEAELFAGHPSDQNTQPTTDFPSLVAVAATKRKKKKGQTIYLAEFTTYAGAKPPAISNQPTGLTHEDILILPIGPRKRTAEELDHTRLGGGFRNYGSNGSYDQSNRHFNGDDSSNSRMNTVEKKQSAKESKLLCFLRAPLKYLIKARDFYIKSMTECSGKLDYALALGCPIGQVPKNLPKSYSLNSAKSSRSDEDYSELIRIASARSCSTKSGNLGVLQRQRIQNFQVKGAAGIPRNFSVAIGRIDEEKSCEFGEEVKVKTGVFQRSGSYAVSRSGY